MWYEGDVKTPARNFGRLVDDGVDEVIAVVLPETESIQQFSDPIWQAALKTWSIYINILMRRERREERRGLRENTEIRTLKSVKAFITIVS